ncbi:MAG: glycosidase, partial [Candidatus Acidiferrales bacterium]
MTQYETLFLRHPGNPILTGKDWPYSINSVFNAGATLLQDGTTLLLCRVEDRRGLSHLCAARSANGMDHWQIDRTPTLLPDPDSYPEEVWGIEDPRITYMPELKKFAVAYTSYSRG